MAIELHPSIQHVLQYFSYWHLPNDLQEVSKDFYDLAHECAQRAPNSPETTVALRKLLEAKDAAVRAALSLHTSHALGDEKEPTVPNH